MTVGTSRDEHWFDSLYAAYHAAVFRFLAHKAWPSLSDVDDLTQQTFITAWQKRHDVPDNPLPWLFRTALNHSYNQHRMSRTRQHLELVVDPADPADGFASAETAMDVTNALNRLSEMDRTVLCLRYIFDLDNPAIANIVGISEVAIRKRLSRAAQHLREALHTPDPSHTGHRFTPRLSAAVPRPQHA